LGLLDRVNGALAASRGSPARPQNLDLDEYASWFSFNGAGYPYVRTTYNQVDQERIAWTTQAAARHHGPAFALITARQQVFSQIRFQWTRFSGAVPGDLFGTPELKVLERPWPNGTTSDLLGKVEWDVSTAGNAYIRRRANTLFRLYPSWVIIVMGSQEDAENPAMAADTTVAGYFWCPPGGKPMFFDPTQVAHIAPIPDPETHFLGQSWISPVIRDLQADQAAVEHKWKFFENNATFNLAVKFDPTLDIAKVKAFKALMEEEHRGVRNAFKTMYLGGGADITPVSMSFADMDYAVVQGRAESRLAAAAGVPPSWVGFSEGLQGSALNAGNFNSARRRFSDGTAVHWWGNVAASFEPLLAAPQGASLWYDQRIPFMRADASDQADIQVKESATIAALVREGFTPQSAIDAVKNNDWSLLTHTGLTSVQLHPPGESGTPGGQDQAGGDQGVTGTLGRFTPDPAPASNGNGNGVHR
jgi:hypothetical protein